MTVARRQGKIHPGLDQVSLETSAILQAKNVIWTASILVIGQAYMLCFLEFHFKSRIA